MNFNYSYRAFLISSLLIGNLILLLVSIRLTNYEEVEEESYSLEYSDEILIDEELVELTPIPSRIETHRAFNEAEKFIADSEEELSQLSEATEARIAKMNEVLNESSSTLALNTPSTDDKEDVNTLPETEKKETSVGGSNRRSTNSYRLEGRQALYFPNPVYTCEGFGTVVIDIEVSNTGKVVKTQFNEALSSTGNLCLVDNALNYARRSRFTTDASKGKQKGTITYLFPGQN